MYRGIFPNYCIDRPFSEFQLLFYSSGKKKLFFAVGHNFRPIFGRLAREAKRGRISPARTIKEREKERENGAGKGGKSGKESWEYH